MDLATILSFLTDVLRDTTPILLVALGITVMQLSGILNIGAEGMMLLGSFAGIVGAYFSGNRWVGVLTGAAAVGVFGIIFAYLIVHLKGNQVVIGVALNILAEGLTTTLSRQVFGQGSQSTVEGFKPGLFGLSELTYLALALVVILTVLLYKTNFGLRVRATGEYPRAVDVAGLNVYRIQYLAVIIGAMIIGIGGTAHSTASLNSFSEAMTTGRGYIALAAVTLGQFKPIGVLVASLIFGLGNSLQIKLQAASIAFPTQFIRMIPYVLTVVAVVISSRNAHGPSALGKTYTKLK